MIRLQQADLDPSLIPTLTEAKRKFGDRTAAAWICGPGFWDTFLPRMKAHTRHYVYLFNHRDPFFTLPAIDNSVLELDGLLELQNALVILRNEHQCPAPNEKVRPSDYHGSDVTILMRPNAYIVMPIERVNPDLYVPMPDTSAHELLEDQQRLDRDFPGIFKVL